MLHRGHSQRELTLRAVLLGIALSIVMGAANVYLGLRAGMTVSASIPAAVVAMVLLRQVLKRGTLLESNQVQTAASAGESLAAGVIFTLPALVLIEVWADFNYWTSSLIALAGGILGVLFMIPLRQVFIVQGDRALTYPEGVACAEVLRAGESGAQAAASARAILFGALAGAAIKFSESFLGLLRGTLEGAQQVAGRVVYVGLDASPALIAVGFIIRLNLALNVFLGGAAGWLLALPLLSAGAVDTALSAQEAAYGIWSSQVRYLGVGAMLVGGLLTLWQVRMGLLQAVVTVLRPRAQAQLAHHERSLKPWTLGLWVILSVGLTAGLYFVLLGDPALALLTLALMLVAAFFFAAVASYIVGLVGNSNSPVSGMTITAVLFAGLLLWLLGFSGTEGMLATLGVAAVVCCVACTSGDVCNDLKTGALVGATPYKQQIMQLLGVASAAFVLAPVMSLLNATVPGGIGGEELPAPQAALFASLARGFFGGGELPWTLVAVGAGLGLAVAGVDRLLQARGSALRLYVMPAAVGLYLPLGLSTAILFGGLLAWWVERRHKASARAVQHRGMLLASGLIAGESLLGIGLALLVAVGIGRLALPVPGTATALLTVLALGLLVLLFLKVVGRARAQRDATP